ncbi:hypothetical protein D3C87_1667480 [compost metagenome]
MCFVKLSIKSYQYSTLLLFSNGKIAKGEKSKTTTALSLLLYFESNVFIVLAKQVFAHALPRNGPSRSKDVASTKFTPGMIDRSLFNLPSTRSYILTGLLITVIVSKKSSSDMVFINCKSLTAGPYSLKKY